MRNLEAACASANVKVQELTAEAARDKEQAVEARQQLKRTDDAIASLRQQVCECVRVRVCACVCVCVLWC
jgi:hypothetical protein